MKFSEEYKSAMNEITPDEKTSARIERAVMDKIAEKPVKSTRKKPIFIGTAVSGAAVCAAIACVFAFRINGGYNGSLNNAAFTNPTMISQSYDEKGAEEIGTNDIAVSNSAAVADIEDNSASVDGTKSQSGLSSECLKDDNSMRDYISVTKDAYSLEFTENGSVIVEKDDFFEEFEQTGLVTRFSALQKNLSPAITEDETRLFILIEDDKLYLFDGDFQTAKQYNKKRSD